MKAYYLFCLLSLAGTLNWGCSRGTYKDPEYNLDLTEPVFPVDVESIAADKVIPQSKKIYIYPWNSRLDVEDRQFRHYAAYLYAALEDYGFYRTIDPRKADIAVLLDYNLSFPQRHTTTFTVPLKTHVPHLPDYQKGRKEGDLPVVEEEEGGWWHPQNYETVTQVHKTFRREIFIQGIDMQRYSQADGLENDNALWKTKIVSIGPDENMPFIFPHLVAAAAKFIAKNTGGKLALSIKAHSPEVIKLQEKVSINNSFYFHDRKKERSKELYTMPDSDPLRLRDYDKPVYETF
ncbi:MAG: hypothetical protein WCG27_08150 [Pseudomonadota bacterium]